VGTAFKSTKPPSGVRATETLGCSSSLDLKETTNLNNALLIKRTAIRFKKEKKQQRPINM
jgi:hypothetical protein